MNDYEHSYVHPNKEKHMDPIVTRAKELIEKAMKAEEELCKHHNKGNASGFWLGLKQAMMLVEQAENEFATQMAKDYGQTE